MNSLILRLIANYEAYRKRTLNLIPSENILSADVLRALSSNIAGRYAGRPEIYAGAGIFHEIWEKSEHLAKTVFRCRSASVAPLSGHMAGLMALDSLCRRGDKIAVVSAEHGGYAGYTSEFLPKVLGLETLDLPYDSNSCNIDVDETLSFLTMRKPNLVILGATIFLFPHPVRAISEVVHRYGGKVLYDGSHVLGLIAGRAFQDPLGEGADLLTGSTHKTLFGPQGGLILSNNEDLIQKIEQNYLYRFMDNIHLNRIAALGVALEEIKLRGKTYARRVCDNARTLALHLDSERVHLAGSTGGYTSSHQVLLTVGSEGQKVRNQLEAAGIIADSRVRLGTNEVTRRGMGHQELQEVASLIKAALSGENSIRVRRKVFEITRRFNKLHYTLH